MIKSKAKSYVCNPSISSSLTWRHVKIRSTKYVGEHTSFVYVLGIKAYPHVKHLAYLRLRHHAYNPTTKDDKNVLAKLTQVKNLTLTMNIPLTRAWLGGCQPIALYMLSVARITYEHKQKSRYVLLKHVQQVTDM